MARKSVAHIDTGSYVRGFWVEKHISFCMCRTSYFNNLTVHRWSKYSVLVLLNLSFTCFQNCRPGRSSQIVGRASVSAV